MWLEVLAQAMPRVWQQGHRAQDNLILNLFFGICYLFLWVKMFCTTTELLLYLQREVILKYSINHMPQRYLVKYIVNLNMKFLSTNIITILFITKQEMLNNFFKNTFYEVNFSVVLAASVHKFQWQNSKQHSRTFVH